MALADRRRRPGGRQAFEDDYSDLARPTPSARRPGTPVSTFASDEESQDAAVIAVGSRVKHRKFGSGTIAEVTGSGPSAKVKVDFDDESVGRKTLVVGQANLERGME